MRNFDTKPFPFKCSGNSHWFQGFLNPSPLAVFRKIQTLKFFKPFFDAHYLLLASLLCRSKIRHCCFYIFVKSVIITENLTFIKPGFLTLGRNFRDRLITSRVPRESFNSFWFYFTECRMFFITPSGCWKQ